MNIATVNGDTNNSCAASTNPATPKQHFMGLNGAVACMSAGDTLIAAAGTYVETVNSIPSGTMGAPTTVRHATNAKVWLAPTPTATSHGMEIEQNKSYITIDGISMDGTAPVAPGSSVGLQIQGDATNSTTYPDHIIYENAEIKNFNYGVQGAINFGQILNNEIHAITRTPGCQNAAFGCDGYGMYYAGNDTLIFNNYYHDTDLYGVHNFHDIPTLATTNRNTYSANVFANTCALAQSMNRSCVDLLLSSGTGHIAYNNVFFGGTGLPLASTGGNSQIYNNTVYGTAWFANDGRCIDPQSSTDITRNNVCNNNTGGNGITGPGTFSNNVSSNAVLGFLNVTDPVNGFQLTSAATLLIDQGFDVSAVVGVDRAGIPRPQNGIFDIGAYEFQIFVPPPPITFDTECHNSNAATNTISCNITVGSGANRHLVVAVASRYDASHDSVNIDGTTSLTKAVEFVSATGAGNHCSLWNLTAPSVGAHTINVSTTGPSIKFLVVQGLSLRGVKQIAPLDQTGSNEAVNSTSVSMSGLTTTMNHAGVIDCMATSGGDAGDTIAMTAESGRVQRLNLTVNSDDTFGVSTILDKFPTGAPTLQWTSTTADAWVVVGEDLFAASETIPGITQRRSESQLGTRISSRQSTK